MQEDVNTQYTKANPNPYVAVNFMVVRVKSKKDRLWEVSKDDIILQAAKGAQRLPQREITETVVLTPEIGGKHYHYIIVPNVENESGVKKDGKPFFLRIFASEQVDLVELPKTIEQTFTGEWKDKSAGGKRIIDKEEETKNGKKETRLVENQQWCCNPQYFLNITKPTHLKITLKKKMPRRTKNKMCGITLTKAYPPTKPPSTNEVGKNNQQGTVKIPSSLPLNGLSY